MNFIPSYWIRYGILMGLTALLFILSPELCSAQTKDSSNTEVSQAPKNKLEKKHSPKLATGLSAALPGLGQIYNKKYWKVPVIYAGVGALLYSINTNSQEYNTYKEAYSLRIDGDTNTLDIFDILLVNNQPKYTEESLLNLKDYYRRNRDVSYIFMGVLYMLNIVDAAVDAHFFNYEITDDLSLEVRPTIMMGAGGKHTTGIGLTLSL